MNLYQDYQFIEPLPGEGPRSFRARRVATSSDVMVHFLLGGKTPQNEALLERLRRLPPSSLTKLVEVGEHEGTTVVVTAAPPNLRLHEWMEGEERAPKAAGPVPGAGPVPNPVPLPQPAAAGPGEFTRLFQSPVPSAPSPSGTPPGPSAGAGEFTRLFQSPPPAPGPSGAPRGPSAGASEFTRLFQSAPPPAPGPSGTPPGPSAGASSNPPPAAGEFTRLFQSPAFEKSQTPAFPPAPNLPAASVPRPAEPIMQQPGEFTQMFARPHVSEPPSPPAQPQIPPAPAPAILAAVVPPRPAMPPAPVAPQLPAIPQPATIPPAAQAQPSSANILLMAIVGLVCFLAGGLVVYLILRR